MKNVYVALVACLLFGAPAAFAQPAPGGTNRVVRLYEFPVVNFVFVFGGN